MSQHFGECGVEQSEVSNGDSAEELHTQCGPKVLGLIFFKKNRRHMLFF